MGTLTEQAKPVADNQFMSIWQKKICFITHCVRRRRPYETDLNQREVIFRNKLGFRMQFVLTRTISGVEGRLPSCRQFMA